MMDMDNDRQSSHHESEIVEVDLRRLFYAILNNIWKIGIIAVLCGAFALSGSLFLLTPKYRASTSFYINNRIDANDVNSNITNNDLTTSKNLVNSYIANLKTRSTLINVIEYANSSRTYNELLGMISATGIDNTEMLKVTVSSENPQEAANLANAIAHVLPEHVSTVIEGSSIKVVDFAVVPESAYFPNYTNNTVLGVLIGLFLSIGVIVLIEVFDVTVKNDEDIKNCCNYPLLATVPDMSKAFKHGYYYRKYYHRYSYYPAAKNDSEASGEKNISFVGKDIDFAATEAYKLLRTKLQYSLADDQKCRVFAVSSALAGEGKSISSVNLAYSLAQLNKRVLLIDCDMRRPTLAKKLALAKYPGLSEHLTGFMGINELLQEYKDADEQIPIRVMTAGNTPPNPVELLNSSKMSRAIAALREQFDYIIMDMPPIGDVSDALVAAKLADGVLIVVRQNYCSRAAMRDAIQQFEFVNSKILGIILNCVTDKVGSYYKKSYYHRYGYRYSKHRHSYIEESPKKDKKAVKKKKK